MVNLGDLVFRRARGHRPDVIEYLCRRARRVQAHEWGATMPTAYLVRLAGMFGELLAANGLMMARLKRIV